MTQALAFGHQVSPPPATNDTSRPVITPRIQRMLDAMEQASTWGHPDLFGEFAGMERFYAGKYKSALKYFKFGARYADKLSQFVIGLMYANGRGVAPDAAAGCAWLTISAERNYPWFVKTRDQVCDALTPGQRTKANATLAELLPVYGDKVAKRRMKLQLMVHLSMRSNYLVRHTGTGTGEVVEWAPGNCVDAATVVLNMALPKGQCVGLGLWSAWRWNAKKYFALRGAPWRASVSVGPLQQVPAPATSTTAKPITH